MASTLNATTASGGGIIAAGDASGILQLQTAGVTGLTIDASQNVSTVNNINVPNTFGFKNRIINGAMAIDQRNAGASVTLTSTGFSYPVDRFFAFRNTGTSGITAQRVSSGLTDLPNALRVQRTNGDTSTTSNGFGQTIESNNSYDFAGNNITLSFRARCGANFSATSSQITARIATGTAADQGSNAGFQGTFTGQINTNTAVTLTTSWQTFTVTLAAPSTALEYQLLFYWANTGTAGANDWVEVTGVQLEKGSTATSFDYRPYGTELALCQRYFISYGGQAVYEPFALGVGLTSTSISCQIQLPVTQRAPLTGMTTLNATNLATNIGAPTSVAFDTANDKVVMFTVNVASGSGANLAARLYANGSTLPRLQFSSEL